MNIGYCLPFLPFLLIGFTLSAAQNGEKDYLHRYFTTSFNLISKKFELQKHDIPQMKARIM